MKELEEMMNHALKVSRDCKELSDKMGEAYFLGESIGLRKALTYLKENPLFIDHINSGDK